MRRTSNRLDGSPTPRSRRAFTLIELLVVIGIIAVLVSILIPVVGRARRASRNVACLANLRSLQNALVSYVGTSGHAFFYQSPSNATTRGQLFTWEGALQPILQNTQVRFCAEAIESSGNALGKAFEAYGQPASPANAIPVNTSSSPKGTITYPSNGSYGFNGFLYNADPDQLDDAGIKAKLYGGHLNTSPVIIAAKVPDYWFSDLTTLDGGAVPQAVITSAGGSLPPGFGPSSSVPAFGDCNKLNAWPISDSATVPHDKPPNTGGYKIFTGYTSLAGGDPVGHFVLNRHPGGPNGGCNIVFLDGSARTVRLEDLWLLRWNKSFVPVPASKLTPFQ